MKEGRGKRKKISTERKARKKQRNKDTQSETPDRSTDRTEEERKKESRMIDCKTDTRETEVLQTGEET